MTRVPPVSPGQILTGSLFNEPMRIETVQANGPASWVVGLVGTQSERFRKVTLTAADSKRLTILDAQRSFDGDGRLLRLGLQAYALGIAYEFDPDFGLSIPRVYSRQRLLPSWSSGRSRPSVHTINASRHERHRIDEQCGPPNERPEASRRRRRNINKYFKGDSPAVFERLKILDDLGSANLSGMARRLASRACFGSHRRRVCSSCSCLGR